MKQKIKVAVIGSTGQLGGDIVEVFSQNDSFECIALSHSDIDIVNIESCNVLKEMCPDFVINTASFVRVDDCETMPEKAMQVNGIGALNIAKVCREIDAFNIYISTDYVFDGNKGEPYTEDDFPNPINVYGTSKYVGEIFTRNYSAEKKWAVVRVASLYGKRGARGKGGNFVEFMIQKAKNNEPICVVDDMIMSPTYTMHVAKMLEKIISERKIVSGIYHMTNEGFCSWYEFTEKIFEILGLKNIELKKINTKNLDRLAKRPLFSVLENKRLKEMGLRMPRWEEALKEYLIEKGYISS